MAADYTIVAQSQTTDLTPDGRFVDVVEVTFQTKDGDTGKVRVPLSDHTAENVAQVVGDRAAAMIAVRRL
ncbi:MAG TPA: hypothetical protein VIV12_01555 [Streptosporangiaceae bacterium]